MLHRVSHWVAFSSTLLACAGAAAAPTLSLAWTGTTGSPIAPSTG